ncbi:MAG: sulfatase-like hydrolase/transferase [Myxococcota bacterium]
MNARVVWWAVGLGVVGVATAAWQFGGGAGVERAEHPRLVDVVTDERGVRRSDHPNIMLIVLDDVGTDMIRGYGDHPRPVVTETVDALMTRGVSFRHAVATPLCSPTRATLLTGAYGFRHGIGGPIAPRKGWGLPADARSLPRELSRATGEAYRSAVIGKWHLASPNHGGFDHARAMGFDHHIGAMGNLHGKALPSTEPMTYTHWTRVVDGEPMVESRYATTATVDDAIEVLPMLGEPYFLWVAFNAAHFPIHAPPEHLTKGPLPHDDESSKYRAMVRVMDQELGRLLEVVSDDLDDDTWVILLGDNGSAPVGVLPPWRKPQSKGALLRGGVRVPFVVAGPGVDEPGRFSDALINTTDVFATIADLVGEPLPVPSDSISFAEVLRDAASPGKREVAFAEAFKPNGSPPWDEHRWMLRNERFKLIMERDGRELLFDLENDAMERNNLLSSDAGEAWASVVADLKAQLPYETQRKTDGLGP